MNRNLEHQKYLTFEFQRRSSTFDTVSFSRACREKVSSFDNGETWEEEENHFFFNGEL